MDGTLKEVLRFATSDDIETLRKMRVRYLQEDMGGLTSEQEQQILAQLAEYFSKHLGKDCFAALVEVDGQAVSFALLSLFEKPANANYLTGITATLFSVYTLPDYRRRGYSTRVFRLLIDKAKQCGASYIELKATKAGKPLYETLGFSEYHSCCTEMRLCFISGESPQ